MKKVYLLGILGLAVMLLLSAMVSALDYRPTCADPATITNKPWTVTNFWTDFSAFDLNGYPASHGGYNLCYVNESLMYIQYDWGIVDNKLFRDMEDIYSTNLGGQSNALKAKDGFTVHFEYYFPSDNGKCYASDTGYPSLYGNFFQSPAAYSLNRVFINNVDYSNANCNGCTDFEQAQYELKQASEISCDTWHVFEMSNLNFENEFNSKDRLVSFGFAFQNAYIHNVWFRRGGVFYQLY